MILIRGMTREDRPLGLELVRRAGWNQTAQDWIRFTELQPDGCFVAGLDESAVATLTTCIFGPVAWVAMVLVDPAMRGRGIGRALMARAIEFLEGRGVRTIRLDATPAGRGLYERLGFVGEYRLARFEGTPEVAGVRKPGGSFDPALLDGVADLDHSVTGIRRGRLLNRLAADHPERVRIATRDGVEVDGYLMERPGLHASQIGPCIARRGVGESLLAEALTRHRGQPVFVDIPAGNEASTALASARGLTVQRDFMRMSRGETVADEPLAIWASFGPEMG